jgi:hypothetical protein
MRQTTGQQQQYVLTNNGLLEVNRVRHAASSWLVDHTFVSGKVNTPPTTNSNGRCGVQSPGC